MAGIIPVPRLLRSSLRIVLTIVILSWAGHALLLYIFQGRYIYYPDPVLTGSPQDYDLEYESVSMLTADGLRLHGWFVPGTLPSRAALYLHGNGGNISSFISIIEIIHRTGLSVLVVDYRGYGQSEGTPSEEGTYEDARTAWRYLEKRGMQQIVIIGHSLGTPIAASLTRTVDPAGLVLLAPLTSIADMAARSFPWQPMSLLVRIKYPTNEFVAAYTGSLLVMHSMDDTVVPYEMGQHLFSISPSKDKQFVTTTAGHHEAFHTARSDFIQPFNGFIQRLTAPPADLAGSD